MLRGSSLGWGALRCSGRKLRSSALRAQGVVGADRPDEPGKLASAGDDDLLGGLAAAAHSAPAPVEPLLAAPGAGDHGRVLAALAASERVGDLWPAPSAPRSLDKEPGA